MRRFELRNGNQRRFWTIAPLGNGRCDVSFGEVGGAARSLTRPIDGSIDAMIAKQLAQGYVEVSDADEVIRTIEPGSRWAVRFARGKQSIEITLDGDLVVQRFDGGQPQLATQASPSQARELVQSMIRQYTADGFAVADATRAEASDDVVPLVLAANPALEAACRDAPDDPVPWGVYRDWLIAHGDARGELAAHMAAGADAEANALLAPRRDALIGPDQISVTSWRHGFPRAVRLRQTDPDDDLVGIARDLFARPFAMFVESLRVGLAASVPHDNDWGRLIAAIADAPPTAHLRELGFDDFGSDDAELSWVACGDFSSAWAHLPRLQSLVIKGGAGAKLGEIVLPELRRFVRISGGLSRTELAAISRARWPALEHLEIWTGSGDYGADTTILDLLPIFSGEGLPTLSHLGVVNSELVDDVIPELARSPLLTRLRTLDLSKGVLAHVGAARLVEHAEAFRHLTSIDLGENHLATSDLARIRAVLPRVTGALQRERYEVDEDDDDHGRYVAVGE